MDGKIYELLKLTIIDAQIQPRHRQPFWSSQSRNRRGPPGLRGL